MNRRSIVLLAVVVGLFALAPVVWAGNVNGAFTAHLSGSNEVPPNDSDATGQAIFRVEGETLVFKLIVANIDDVVAAHIHCDGPPGVNGPVSVPLFGGGPTSDNGILSQGVIDASDLTGACGITTFDGLIEEIEAGNAYVNVHTVLLPGGEIRGQVS